MKSDKSPTAHGVIGSAAAQTVVNPKLEHSIESYSLNILDEVVVPTGKDMMENTSYVPPDAVNTKPVSYTTVLA